MTNSLSSIPSGWWTATLKQKSQNQPPGACFPSPTAAARRRTPRCLSPLGDLRRVTRHTRIPRTVAWNTPLESSKTSLCPSISTHLARRSRPAAAPSYPKTKAASGRGLSRRSPHQIGRRDDWEGRWRLLVPNPAESARIDSRMDWI